MWEIWMRRALALAALAQGHTSPNPLVGALVLDRDGRLVGEGFHARAGEAHAEVGALLQAGAAARGGTLVVTLEPCCHHGRTPPCSEAVVQAGIRRVVVALEDPDPRVDGGGIRQLREAGLEVISGVLRDEALQQNRAFLHRVRTGRPFGILKWAMSLDGRTALPNGASQWISGPLARDWVHQLRSGMDAVIVGGGTVRVDDPLLTSRGRRSPEPLRVVLSRSLDLPDQAQLWNTAVASTLVAHGPDADPNRLPCGPEGLGLSVCDPLQLMEVLAQRGCNQVLWECGPELAAAAIRQGCVQEIAAVVAPKLMGGTAARTPLGELDFSAMDEVLQGGWHQCEPLGQDWLLRWRSSS
ncbi:MULTISPECIES: bifunctional diaminohydroxyphosphoribosylaminopyrimidine deaminase/5-amino-6-(5-phosphoribosylamino)uracil reductase RibD [unclassified Synechococcus]|uniref:bifunctional diaminohydroxyphosphoribosylaminopyrimidine deaminase/5-amino-6-(5-phosphoribosylamino)uracil reductase RibD n=1 Tax=unclassified Synechococcus TaxID=2626047 RepID=UPI001CF80396|nr:MULTISPECIES: bifunctional diaminohydroxyphosphoribosylaminopyrimidine deaminase/5-amino-6-(5-phosphoribosylamino)uracil reductase RibD [unclassified Synechococcus]MCB4377182.1 bifunctional diaminohydroxyphosphoribosylaminopyrimidine deaminase/5-amino-6-(5-phosphoribosylamino)uracil reductase RibD [Synechococcus sp. MU1650]